MLPRRSLFTGLVLLGALWVVASARADLTPARAPAIATTAMVAAADPRAVDAALEILKAGGSATDAAISAAIVLGLVEPQSSGIGGGGFLLHFNAADGTIESYDGRELAPAAVTPDMFLTPDDKRQKRRDVALGGLAVGVPGLFRMMALAHESHGHLPWARLFEPAIALAAQGFEISPQLGRSIAETEGLDTFEETRAYFFRPDGTPK
ncbi:MAG: gamma-glutamyltransferase, partial [SAR202 cluster bacterium]|nr:gamma-glutamyltransferase [SAR202 cluster bacterium]